MRLIGTIVATLPNDMFDVRLEDGQRVLCHIAAEYRMHYVRLVPGDRVEIEVSAYDKGRGRITGQKV